ncbi:MAG TPA: TIGR03943 family protein [Crinalium sp.]|jgi:uncharacterized repeat protein (TIGR03943 family)
MTVNPTSPRSRRSGQADWRLWLDVLAILAWGVLLLKYWVTGKMNILLHPDYMWLPNVTSIFLVLLGSLKAWQLLQIGRRRQQGYPTMQHLSMLPRGWSSGLLLVAALVGLQFTPQPFASQVALDRGVTDTLTMTRSQPQAFRGGTRPEERSLIDWVRTLNVYPEPDAYKGQTASVEGFVIQTPGLPAGYFTLARFVITCCAADVYPVGLPVKLGDGQTPHKPDTWLHVDGQMTTETFNGQRQLVILAKSLKEIPQPKNPYDY